MTSDVRIVQLKEADVAEFKREMQRAFQYGYEVEYGPAGAPVLPERDIDQSLYAAGAAAYVAEIDGVMVGGAVVKIDPSGRRNHLELLFVKVGVQSRGVGQVIWEAMERTYPETRVWETFTPWFEKRNIHFYVNRCGFHIVEFFNPYHPFPPSEWEYCGGMSDEACQYFFRFEKVMGK